MSLESPIIQRWRTHPRPFIAVMIALFLAFVAVSFVTKSPWWDEGWCASPAFNLITRGTMGTSFVAPNGWLHGLDRHTYLIPPLYIVGLAGWFKLVGFGLLRMRAFSTVWALLAFTAWWSIARRLFGQGVALLALALLATDYVFVSMATEGRLDMMSTALGASAWAAYLALRERSLTRAILAAAALAAASALTHPCGALFTGGALVLVLTYDRRRLEWRHLAVAVLPYVFGGLAWGLYALQDPGDFMSQFGGNVSHRVQVATPFHAIREELNRYVRAYAYGPVWAQNAFNLQVRPVRAWPLLVPVTFAVVLVWGAVRRELRADRGHRALLIIALMGIVFLTFFESNKRYYHLLYVVPVFVALLASTVARERRRGPRVARALAAGLAVFVAVNVALVVRPMVYDTFHTSYIPMIRFLRSHADHDALVMGSSELAFGLGFDARLIDDYTLGYYGGPTPDWIVINARYHERLRDPNEPAPIRAFMEQRLAAYRQVYDVGRYVVYAKRESTARVLGPDTRASSRTASSSR